MTSDNYQQSHLLNFRLPQLLKFHLPESACGINGFLPTLRAGPLHLFLGKIFYGASCSQSNGKQRKVARCLRHGNAFSASILLL
jgi:hypothetical protein